MSRDKMANFVIKKDGAKEPFDAGKIKQGVSMAANQAGIPLKEAESLADQVAGSIEKLIAGVDEIPSADIREKILSLLDEMNPKVAQSWRDYETSK